MKAIVYNNTVELLEKEGTYFPATDGVYNLEKTEDGRLLIHANGRVFTARLISLNKAEKTMEILLNNQRHIVAIKEPLDDLLHSMGLDKMTNAGASQIKAPMPGLVLDVAVKVGDTVAKGDKVLVLEAMKMENIIKASGDGTVARILVDKGQTVDKNQILIEFE
ncbi:MAG: acetyl-CoA carboxylase biotin carboxyl carrier protein subunit [Bacteroidia bacterium]|jgi:biotin carboxyl carrier protein